ncbi:MAG: hypothetical protein ACXW3R_15245 [Rhodoplanes sp.]
MVSPGVPRNADCSKPGKRIVGQPSRIPKGDVGVRFSTPLPPPSASSVVEIEFAIEGAGGWVIASQARQENFSRTCCALPHQNVTEDPAPMTGVASPNRAGAPMARWISMGARREVVWAVAQRYGAAGRREKGRILDELTATTGWHRKHAVRALSALWRAGQADCSRVRRRSAQSTARHSHRPVTGASTQVLAMH